jgi:ABC-type multidrug transport system ATPase subunit
VAGHDPLRDPDAVRAAIGVTGQFANVDNLLTGEENLILMADLHRLGRAEGRRRAAELLDPVLQPREPVKDIAWSGRRCAGETSRCVRTGHHHTHRR